MLVVGAMSCRQSKSAPTIGCAVDHLYGRCHINKQAQSSKEAGLTVCRHAKYNVRFGSLADIGQPIRDVRFTPESGHAHRRHRRPVEIEEVDMRRINKGGNPAHPILICGSDSGECE